MDHVRIGLRERFDPRRVFSAKNEQRARRMIRKGAAQSEPPFLDGATGAIQVRFPMRLAALSVIRNVVVNEGEIQGAGRSSQALAVASGWW